jgi:hypothetical protein
MADSVELFNQHQADAKGRFNFLVQAVLLLSGGALTASVTIFTGSRTIQLNHTMAKVLAFSWWALVVSICLAVVSVVIILLRDYFLGERWRKSLADPSVDVKDRPGLFDVALFVCGFAALLAFLAGFVAMAVVATNVVVA